MTVLRDLVLLCPFSSMVQTSSGHSLNSCFCKMLGPILITRLMFRLQDKLYLLLYGFLPQRSFHHCLMDLCLRLSPTNVVAFLDLKSALDVDKKERLFSTSRLTLMSKGISFSGSMAISATGPHVCRSKGHIVSTRNWSLVLNMARLEVPLYSIY